MSEIINNISLNTYYATRGPGRSGIAAPAAKDGSPVSPGQDTVELSDFGRALAEAANESSYRLARIRAVRHEIQQGTYETPERVARTVDRLRDVIG